MLVKYILLLSLKGLTWPFLPTNSSILTGIYGFDFQKPNEDLVWLPLQGNFNQEFILSYHGVSAWEDKTNGTFEYVLWLLQEF